MAPNDDVSPRIYGSCPGVTTPMQAADGLLIRISPPFGKLTGQQAKVLGQLAQDYGNGFISLTNRANLQLRGISHEHIAPLTASLQKAGLVADEKSPHILVSPFAQNVETIYRKLSQKLQKLNLPDKFGIALDINQKTCLHNCPADIRLEYFSKTRLFVRADGSEQGLLASPDDAVNAAYELACWFAEKADAKRMRNLLALGHKLPEKFTQATGRPVPGFVPMPGQQKNNHHLIAFAFGEIPGKSLTALGQCGTLHITPWRMLLVKSADPASIALLDGVITTSKDPLLRMHACTGAPSCEQAHGQTRPLATMLAPILPAKKGLHISGCRKYCAMAGKPLDKDITMLEALPGMRYRIHTIKQPPKTLTLAQITENPHLIFS